MQSFAMSDSKLRTKCNLYPIVMFFPHNYFCENGYLCGEIVNDDLLKTKNYFIHEIYDGLNCRRNDVIGVIGRIAISNIKNKQGDWIKLKIVDKIPFLVKLVSDHGVVKREDCQVIMYDRNCFMRSELILTVDDQLQPCEEIVQDHFKRLVFSLKYKQNPNKSSKELQPFNKSILISFIIGLKFIDTIISRFRFVLKFSTLAIHMSTFVQNAVWVLELIQSRGCFTALKSGNYILGLIGDWFGGLLFIYWFMSLISIEDVLQMLAAQSQVIVISLKDMVHYLMGSPADLKLNGPLNSVLGKFFLFHIDLWWAFLGYSRPLLELGFHTFISLGFLGLSFQIAILADLLAVASFHVYIIYVYAARLYNAQLMGLASLSRVFLGRKHNPLPGRVDSCPYTTEQLLIGTIAFTVLLFLLPTTMVYYIVFTVIRLVLIAVGGLLTQARFALSALPLYSTVLWLCNSPATTSCVRLTPKMATTEDVVLLASPVQSSWWQTVKACVPDPISSPPPVLWRQLFWQLLIGQLVYPV